MMLEPVVFLVDDDLAVRDSLSLLIKSVGLNVIAYEHPQAFLDDYDASQVGCLILDIRMPGISGLTIQDILKQKGYVIPIIFITGHGDIAQCTRAFKAGAVDFLTKPVDEQSLIDSLQMAIKSSIELHRQSKLNADVYEKISRLSERENQVLHLLVEGMPNKVIADRLKVSTRTVESHRAKLFEKLEVSSLAECVRIQLSAAKSI
ncbi:response regulator [Undibacterium sp. CCC2.1]|uniref:response regulator transcription factor n=2 Tax=unclassified Undibacterium TaxID=2630295 RepID=UPI002B224BD7|nr:MULTISPECIES: response regulator [unclassified Undibacterium]MEB0141212.1 response regulator [Undibacterium sp. CCC2.1]MEB0174276.1 response regulator [Undibacterium sp. CCC1.1]MEB0178210.1 response regulator [Undibacterium sp. CCC3.4]